MKFNLKQFIKDVKADLKDKWPDGTPLAHKNNYRWQIVYLMGGLAVASIFIWAPIAIAPVAVAVRKLMIIKKDKA